MSYTFRVIFDGVCAWVPDHPFFPDEKSGTSQVHPGTLCANEVDVLLPDLSRAELNTQPAEGLRVFRSPHFALLKFDLPDLHRKTTRRVDLVTRDISTQNEEGLLFLKREQIRFRLKAENATTFRFADWRPTDASGAEEPAKPKSSDSQQVCCCCRKDASASDGPRRGIEVPCPKHQDQLDSLWWMPRLQDIAPDYQRVRSEHLSTHFGPLPEELQARVEIRGGFLKTYDFNRDVDGEPLPWRFLPANADTSEAGKWNRAIGNRQALEFFDVQGPVTIELKRIANDVHVTELVLDLPPGAHRPVLEVKVTNSEPESLFNVQDRLTAQLPDPDFEEFYYMHSDADEAVWKKGGRPVPNPSGFGFLGIEDKPCSSVEMSRSKGGSDVDES